MDEIAFQEKLTELLQEVRRVPALERPTLNGTRPGDGALQHNKMKSQMAALQDSLDYLRLSIKYLVFDLEATKRENRVLRQTLCDCEA